MTDAKHAAPGDRSFATSVLRNLGGAVLLVVLMAGVFWAIGSVGRQDGEPAAGDDPTGVDDGEVAAPEPADPGPDDPGTGDPGPEDPGAEEPGPAAPDPGDPGPGTAEPDDGAGDDEGVEDGAPADEPEPTPDPGPAAPIDPSSISVQVLDGYQADGGAAARDVAAQLREAGYRVVAENPALRYEVTTVLWTAGSEEAARQVAVELGAPEVREQPGNLSTQVMVHVVVGADRG